MHTICILYVSYHNGTELVCGMGCTECWYTESILVLGALTLYQDGIGTGFITENVNLDYDHFFFLMLNIYHVLFYGAGF